MKNKPIIPTHWFDVPSTGVLNPSNTDYRCTHCQQHVSANVMLAGVYNRNHCPYCLWSRHMDWRKPGDRLAACKAPMRPIGLTMKHGRNKYAAKQAGELMLIHVCTDCGKVSINRLAADDDCDILLEVYEASFSLECPLRVRLDDSEIRLLQAADQDLLTLRLFGKETAFVDVA